MNTALATKGAIAMLQAGTVIQSRYQIERVLAQGGMGVVYAARRTDLGEAVAVKEMTVGFQAVGKFEHEADLLASLSHPGLVRTIDHFEHGGAQYLSMEFVDGVTLELLLNEVPVLLPVAQVVSWLKQISEVLVYLHQQPTPIVVRDLKPGNVMVDSYDRIKLIDLGIASTLSSQPSEFLSPGFAPPEQYGGLPDARTDIYALGATAYALLTRTVPAESLALQEGRAKLVPISVINSRVPAALEEIVYKMMAPQPQNRFQSAAEVLNALRSVARALPRDGTSQHSPLIRCQHCHMYMVRGSTRCLGCHPELRHGSADAQQPPLVQPAAAPSGASERMVTSTVEWSGAPPPAAATPLPSPPRSRVWLVACLLAVLLVASASAYFLFGGHKQAPKHAHKPHHVSPAVRSGP